LGTATKVQVEQRGNQNKYVKEEPRIILNSEREDIPEPKIEAQARVEAKKVVEAPATARNEPKVEQPRVVEARVEPKVVEQPRVVEAYLEPMVDTKVDFRKNNNMHMEPKVETPQNNDNNSHSKKDSNAHSEVERKDENQQKSTKIENNEDKSKINSKKDSVAHSEVVSERKDENNQKSTKTVEKEEEQQQQQHGFRNLDANEKDGAFGILNGK
jgi:hypothetical protein